MTFAMSIDQEFDGMPLGTQGMEYSILAEYEVMATTAAGDDRVTTRFVEVEAEPLLQDAMDMMIGLEVNQTISPRGEIRDGSFALPSDLDPTLATMLDQMAERMDDLAAPLPLGPVGVGATWSHSATTDLGGYEATMVTT